MGFQFMDFYGFQEFYGISMGLFPYFTEIIGKIYCLGFRISDSSKISAQISASVSKISACSGPSTMTECDRTQNLVINLLLMKNGRSQ